MNTAPSPGFRLQVSSATGQAGGLSDAVTSDLMIIATDGPSRQSILAGFSSYGSNPVPSILRIDSSDADGSASVSVAGTLYASRFSVLGGKPLEEVWHTTPVGSTMLLGSNVGIGTADPAFPLDVVGHIRATGNIIASGFRLAGGLHASSLVGATLSSCAVPYSCLVGAPWKVEPKGNVVLSGCNVGIGTADPKYILDVVGMVRATGGFTAFSDARFKTDVRPIPDALDKVREMTGYTYRMKSDPILAPRQMGLLAQEVRRVVPELVQGDDDVGLSVAYGNMVALLVEAIKSIDMRLDNLDMRLDNLEQSIGRVPRRGDAGEL